MKGTPLVLAQHSLNAGTIEAVCDALQNGAEVARGVVRQRCPFVPQIRTRRTYTPLDAARVFIRDEFIDRYSGERLVLPGVLRLVSEILGDDFPFHPNWRTDLTHPAYWYLFPTLDHVQPVSKAGADEEDNWVTTSQLRNSAKGNWSLAELGWTKLARGKFDDWDGLLVWFFCYMTANPKHLENSYLKIWYAAGKRAFEEYRSLNSLT